MVGRCPTCRWWFVCVAVNVWATDADGIRELAGRRMYVRRHEPCPPRQAPLDMTGYADRVTALRRKRRVVTEMEEET